MGALVGGGPPHRMARVAGRPPFRQTFGQSGRESLDQEGRMLTTRNFFRALAFAALAIASAAPATADTVKVGLILPNSGPFASLASIMDD